MSERAAPFHCPYCGEEDLRPGEEGPQAWGCVSCGRAFRLTFLGLLASARGGTGDSGTAARTAERHNDSDNKGEE